MLKGRLLANPLAIAVAVVAGVIISLLVALATSFCLADICNSYSELVERRRSGREVAAEDDKGKGKGKA